MNTPLRGSKLTRGHGALSNPPGRFERRTIEAVDDGWFQAEVPESVPLELRPDRARSVISTNDSPDIPFEQSINPYRGCTHACAYCLRGDTPILMGDGRLRAIAQVEAGSEIYGTAGRGPARRYVRTRVLAQWSVLKPAYRLVLHDGTELIAGADHRFLTVHGWKFVAAAHERDAAGRPCLRSADELPGTGRFAAPIEQDRDYRYGYLCGLSRGGASEAREAGADDEVLLRAREYLADRRLWAGEQRLVAAAGAALPAVRAATWARLATFGHPAEWPQAPSRQWCAGVLAGAFDAAGAVGAAAVRIFDSDPGRLERLERYCGALGLRCGQERTRAGGAVAAPALCLPGGLREQLEFFHRVDPASRGKRDIQGRWVRSDAALRVVSIEPAGTMRLYDMTTASGDFIANGIVSHNCYARPSHAYVGLSPGRDFETRLLYKVDASRLLEGEFARSGYVCKPITLGANTDPYQPVERGLRVTRGILEVLARCRHPVTVITKGALVLRDLDLLGALARDNLVRVGISITTLDEALKRTMEPQAASPAARLRVVRELTAAGVPTGVLVAPVIPALTDHEMEHIVHAAAEAGADWASYILLRLPHEVSDLFREWLEAHYPDRAPHVLSLIRQMRRGRDNDPRFGSRMRGEGPFAELLRARFQAACRRAGLQSARGAPLDVSLFRPPQAEGQLTLEL
jgi:DNA repair photolyase